MVAHMDHKIYIKPQHAPYNTSYMLTTYIHYNNEILIKVGGIKSGGKA